MFGFFRKQASADEFGQAVVHYAQEFLASDAGRALGTQFEDYDASQGWSKFLETRGVSIPKQKLHFRLFTHCAVQAACTQFEENIRSRMVRGAIGGFSTTPEGYEFQKTYDDLEATYNRTRRFPDDISALSNNQARIAFLPNPDVGVLNAKYLIESFIVPNLKNKDAYLNNFDTYSSTVTASIATACRAIGQLSKSFKIT